MTARHARWIRRGALLACLLGLAALGAGWWAIGAAGDEQRPRAAAATATPPGTAKLPQLPDKMRPRVVEPQAGASGEAPDVPARDPGLSDQGPSPKRAASNAGRRPTGVLGEAAGGGPH